MMFCWNSAGRGRAALISTEPNRKVPTFWPSCAEASIIRIPPGDRRRERALTTFTVRFFAAFGMGQGGARIMGAAALTPAPSGSGEADVVRPAQLQHAIEHVSSDVRL